MPSAKDDRLKIDPPLAAPSSPVPKNASADSANHVGSETLTSAHVDTPAHFVAFGPPRIEGYRIVREISRGGQGVVYEAVAEGSVGGTASDEGPARRDRSDEATPARRDVAPRRSDEGKVSNEGYGARVSEHDAQASEGGLAEQRGASGAALPVPEPHHRRGGFGSDASADASTVIKSRPVRVAIKMLKFGAGATETERKRFAREVRLLSTLSHANVVRVLSSGEAGEGSPYAVMEYVEGRPLHHFVQERGLDLLAVVRLLIEVCEGLSAAHRLGIIHRDVKPSNILVRPDGTPCLLDFGLAKRLDTVEGKLTSTDDVLGTVPYMSPEQATGSANLDARSDVYSLGVVMYNILTGRFPYPVSNNLAEVVQHILETPPGAMKEIRAPGGRPISSSNGSGATDGDVPLASVATKLDSIVSKALAKSPRDRYQSMAALADELRRVAGGQRLRRRVPRNLGIWLQRARVLIRKQPLAASCAVAVLVAPLVGLGDRFILQRATGWSVGYAAGLIEVMQMLNPHAPLREVVIVKVPPEPQLEQELKELGVIGYRAGASGGFRLVLARLLPLLAEAGAPVLSLTSILQRSTPHDEALATALRSVRKANVTVTVPLATWDSGDDPDAGVAPALRGLLRAAPATGRFDGETVWDGIVAVERGAHQPWMSQDMLTLSAARRPGWNPQIRFAAAPATLALNYWRRAEQRTDQQTWHETGEFLQYSVEELLDEDESSLLKGDRLAHFYALLPEAGTLAASSIPLRWALSTSPAALRARIAGRMVIVESPVAAPALETPTLKRVDASAAAAGMLENLAHSVKSQARGRGLSEMASLLFAAACGALVGARLPGRSGFRLATLLAGCVACLALSTALAWGWRLIWVPLAAIASWLFAAELTAALRRFSAPSWESAQ